MIKMLSRRVGKLILITLQASTFLFLHAAQAESPEKFIPLYAGTQLAFYPNNAAPGYISIQTFFSYIHRNGIYDSNWSKKSLESTDGFPCLFALETGITSWLDVSLYLNGAYRHFGNKNSWIFGDTGLFFGIQLLHDQKKQWIPDLRLVLGETFPTGKYDRLNPNKGSSDAFGTGAYTTTAILVIAKTFYTFPEHLYS